MEQSFRLSEEALIKAREFHLQHFPNQIVPVMERNQHHAEAPPKPQLSNDLGCYEDGTRRTLTDEQITMFRHSEVQRLLAARRRERDAEEEKRSRRGHKEHQPIRKQQAISKSPASTTRYDNDSTIHASMDTGELNYDEDDKQPRKEKSTTFQWPLLGA